MDSRYTDLRAVLAYQGLNEEERSHGLDLLDRPAPADRCYWYATLLQGALADRFNLLGNTVMAKNRGLAEGAKLMRWLLNDQRGQGLTPDEVDRGLLAMRRVGLTCNALLACYLQTRRYLETQRLAA